MAYKIGFDDVFTIAVLYVFAYACAISSSVDWKTGDPNQ